MNEMHVEAITSAFSTAEHLAEAASEAAQNAASLVSFGIGSLETIFHKSRTFLIEDNDELVVWEDFVEIDEKTKGWFGKEKTEKKLRSRYIPLPVAVEKLCPEGCVFLAFTLD